MNDDLDTVLNALRAQLPGLQSQDTIDDHAAPFCDAFYKLYWLWRGDLTAAETTQIIKFLEETVPTMKPAFGFLLQDLLNRMDETLNTSFQSLEWIKVCEMRSTYDALVDMYRDHLPVGLYLMDKVDVDDLIETMGNTEAQFHPTLTPDHFPSDHWWWKMG